MINGSDENRFTLALSETQKTIHMNAGVHEEDGTILFSACIDAGELEEVDGYSIALYLNQEKSPVWKAVDDVRFWWEKTMGLLPLGVPDTARYPVLPEEAAPSSFPTRNVHHPLPSTQDSFPDSDTKRYYSHPPPPAPRHQCMLKIIWYHLLHAPRHSYVLFFVFRKVQA